MFNSLQLLSSMFVCFLFSISTTALGGVSASASDLQDVCSDPDGAVPHPTDCRSYYQCTKGLPTLVTCPNNRVFDEKTKYCVLEHLSQSACLQGKNYNIDNLVKAVLGVCPLRHPP